MHPGGFGHLPDSAGPGLAGALDMWEPGTRSDQELIDRIGSWEKVKAWAEAGQLAEIAELAARRRAALASTAAATATRTSPSRLRVPSAMIRARTRSMVPACSAA